ncbi:MAG: hypothetical protein EXS00_06735 [Phycisphaerales bacterium]|nr:hypothetical protein [Phycisphaerales bacterium]
MKLVPKLAITLGLTGVAALLGYLAGPVAARTPRNPGDGGLAGGGTDCATAPAASLGANAYDTSSATASLVIAAGGGCDAHTMYKVNYFIFAPAQTGNYTFSTCDSATWDTRVAVLATCGANQIPVACNDDACAYQSNASGPLVAGSTYRIALGGYGSGDGGASSLAIAFSGSGGGGGTVGPDVIVGAIPDIAKYGSVVVGGQTIMAYAIGTTSCNIGDSLLDWFASPDNRHPFIPQNFYRIKSGRIEHIGQGWGKHGFYALQEALCGTCTPSSSGSWLGVGCSDPYDASLNGSQGGLGTRTEVNAATGVFPGTINAGMPAAAATIGRRIQVKGNDLNPALNVGAIYLAEAQYIHPGDAASLNDDNNASWRQMVIGTLSNGAYNITFSGATVQQQAAIKAWRVHVPAVTLVDIDVAGDGRFTLGFNVTNNGNGTWHYEYAIENLNSDRSGRSFSIPVPAGTTITNAGFRDIDYHSGDAYSPTDWTVSTAGNAVTWTGGTYSVSANSNALRFGTIYNFWFDANQPRQDASATLGLFKPGVLPSVAVAVQGPRGVPSYPGDLNGDTIVDATDLAILLSAWGTPGAADLDNSGTVDAADLATMLSLWS